MKFAKRTLAVFLTLALGLGVFALSVTTNETQQHSYYTLEATFDPATNTLTPANVDLSSYDIRYGDLQLRTVSTSAFLGMIFGKITPNNPNPALPEGGAAFVGDFTPSWRNMVPTGTVQFNLSWNVPGFSGFTLSSSDENVFRISEEGWIITGQPGTAYFQLTFNNYPITIQQPITVTPRTGGFEAPDAFLFDPHVVSVNTDETATATLSLVPGSGNVFAIPSVSRIPDDGPHFITSSNPDVATAEMPVIPDDIGEQFENYHGYLMNQGLSQAEIEQRLEQFQQEFFRRYWSSVNIVGHSPGRAVISLGVAALGARGELIEPWGAAMYYLEVFVAEPPPPITMPNPRIPGQVNVSFPEGTFPADIDLRVYESPWVGTGNIIDGAFPPIAAWDIWFELPNGTELQPDGVVTVRLPIPATFTGDPADLVVWHMPIDGVPTPMPTRVEGNYVVFETDRFSTYVIAESISVRTLTHIGTGISIAFREDLLPKDAELFVQAGRNVNIGLFLPNGFPLVLWRIEPRVNGVAVQPSGNVTVRIPVPANFTGDTQELRLELAGQRMDTRMEGNYIVFETDSF